LVNKTPPVGPRYWFNREAALVAADQNILLVRNLSTWAAGLDPAGTLPEIPAELATDAQRTKLHAALNGNPNRAQLITLLDEAKAHFGTVAERCEHLHDGRRILVFGREVESLLERNFAEAEIDTDAMPAVKNDSASLQNIEELRSFLLSHYHLISNQIKCKKDKQNTKLRGYSAGQFSLRVILLKAILKLNDNKPISRNISSPEKSKAKLAKDTANGHLSQQQIKERTAKIQEAEKNYKKINQIARDLGFETLGQLDRIFWGAIDIQPKHVKKALKELKLEESSGKALSFIGIKSQVAATEIEYQACIKGLGTKYQTIEDFIHDIDPSKVKYPDELLTTEKAVLAPSQQSHLSATVLRKTFTREGRLALVKDLAQKLKNLSASIGEQCHKFEALIKFFLSHDKLCGKNHIRSTDQKIDEKVLTKVNKYLGGRHNFALKDNGKSKDYTITRQLNLAFNYILELFSKVNSHKEFLDLLLNKERLETIYKQAITVVPPSHPSVILPWQRQQWDELLDAA
jgi:hypothetical protein